MDIQFQKLSVESKTRSALKTFYFYVYAPYNVRIAVLALLLIAFSLSGRGVPFDRIFPCFGAGILIGAVVVYFRWIAKMLKAFRSVGVYDTAADIHVTDTWFEVRRGENISRLEYRVFNHFFIRGEVIFLMRDTLFGNAFEMRDFPDGGTGFIECLRSNGVTPLRFWALRRWYISYITIALFAAAGYLIFF